MQRIILSIIAFSFITASEIKDKTVEVTAKFVEKNIGNLTKARDLKKYVL